MGNWQGDNYEEIPPAENPKEADTVQRRADIYREIKDLGHPSLFNGDKKRHYSRKYDVSYRQINYDVEAVAEFVAETLSLEKHVTDVSFVFEKAMSEAIDEGNWEEAADIAMQQAEWLERRGIIDNEDVDKHELSVEHEWRNFLEEGDDEESEIVDVDAEVLADEQD